MTNQREVKFVDDDPSKPNPWEGRAFPAIGPNGDLLVRFADTNVAGWQDAKAGQCPITLNSGRPAIHPDFARRGFVLYEDLCKGRVSGVAASPEHWGYWQRLAELRRSGREPAPGSIPAEKFYHPEVMRRRERANQGGLNGLDAAEVAAFLGFAEAKPIDAFSAVFGEPADGIADDVRLPSPIVATGVIDEDHARALAEALPTASPSSKRKGQG